MWHSNWQYYFHKVTFEIDYNWTIEWTKADGRLTLLVLFQPLIMFKTNIFKLHSSQSEHHPDWLTTSFTGVVQHTVLGRHSVIYGIKYLLLAIQTIKNCLHTIFNTKPEIQVKLYNSTYADANTVKDTSYLNIFDESLLICCASPWMIKFCRYYTLFYGNGHAPIYMCSRCRSHM